MNAGAASAAALVATCHCGAVEVEVEVPVAPSMVSNCNCNCSICRRYGVLWAYYPAAAVRVRAAPGATDGYRSRRISRQRPGTQPDQPRAARGGRPAAAVTQRSRDRD